MHGRQSGSNAEGSTSAEGITKEQASTTAANNAKISPCLIFAFTSTSPLPQTTIGANYTYQLQTSGGAEPLTYFLYRQSTEGRNTPDQIPRGLTVSPSGLVSGQVDGSALPQNYYFEVGVVDSCPSGARFVARKFYLLVKPY